MYTDSACCNTNNKKSTLRLVTQMTSQRLQQLSYTFSVSNVCIYIYSVTSIHPDVFITCFNIGMTQYAYFIQNANNKTWTSNNYFTSSAEENLIRDISALSLKIICQVLFTTHMSVQKLRKETFTSKLTYNLSFKQFS